MELDASKLRGRTIGAAAAAVVGVAWVFLVLVNYYIVHKPFGLANAAAIANTLGDIGVALLLYVLSAALGHRLLRRFEFVSAPEALAFQAGAGLGVISLVTLGLGLAGLLNRLLFWALLLLGLLLLRKDSVAIWQEARKCMARPNPRFGWILVVYIIFVLALAATAALAPTIAWDAQLYHLYEGKVYLEQGRIAAPPDIVSFNYPAVMEMLYLAAMVLKGDGAAGLIHLGFALLTIGALVGLGRRIGNSTAGLSAGALLLAVPSFVLVSSWPYNDAGLAFFSFAALSASIYGIQSEGRRWLVLSGVLAGFALGFKYTACIIPVALLVVLWLGGRRNLKDALCVLAPAALVASPWYIRNLFFTGNPIYPFLFGGRFWDAFRAYWFSGVGTGLWREPWRLLAAPWEATVLGTEGTTSYEATIGPLLLLLLPFALLAIARARADRARWQVVRSLLAFTGVLYVFWLSGVASSAAVAQTRLLFPAFGALALLAAFGLEESRHLDLPRFSMSGLLKRLVALVLGLTLVGQGLDWIGLNPLPVLVGAETREVYLTSHLTPGYWDAMQFLRTQPNSKVLFLWEPRGYYAPEIVKVQTDDFLNNFPHLIYLYHDPEGIARALRSEGYTHILVARWGLEFAAREEYAGMEAREIDTIEELISSHAQRVYGQEDLSYALDAEGIHLKNVDTQPYVVYAIRN